MKAYTRERDCKTTLIHNICIRKFTYKIDKIYMKIAMHARVKYLYYFHLNGVCS